MKLLQKHLHRIWRIFLNNYRYTVTPGHTRAHSTFITLTSHPTHTHLLPIKAIRATATTSLTKNQVQPKKTLDSHLPSTEEDPMLTETQFKTYRSASLKSITDQKLPLDEQRILREKFENMTYSSWRAKEQTMNCWLGEHEKSQHKAENCSRYGF